MRRSDPRALAQAVEDFRGAMRAAGIDPPADVRADGKLRRFHVEGDRRGSANGWYVLHGDNVPAGAFGSWKLGVEATWCAKPEHALTAAEREAHAERAARAREQREREEARRHAEAARRAASLWRKAKPATAHPYLERKGIAAHGARVGTWPTWERDDAGQWRERELADVLLVPMMDAAGELRALQGILPERDPARGDKRFLAGAAKRGLRYVLGELVGIDAAEGEMTSAWTRGGCALALAEGFATGASVREAAGIPVVVAFDAGNLASVAQALRAAHPRARLIICADNDASGTGQRAAAEAAQAVGALVAIPERAGEDVNDLGQRAGAEAVLRALECALPAADFARAHLAAGDRGHQEAERADELKRFELRDDAGVFVTTLDREGVPRARWICAPLRVVAQARDPASRAWGVLVEFSDPDGHEHRVIVPAEMFAGESADAVRLLLDRGLAIAPGIAKKHVIEYLQTSRPRERARTTPRVGWHGSLDAPVFVTPSRVIGADGELWLYQGDAPASGAFRSRGTLDEWREHVGALCRGNSRLVFAASAAFASALPWATGGEGGGFHFRGPSSLGKTTLLAVATSTVGAPESMQRWRATDNALEAVALAHTDAPLVLDELAQVDGKLAGEIAYLLANGQGKSRARREGGLRDRATWRVLFLSSGELGLADHMMSAGRTARAGQEVRLVEIPADAGAGLGCFEDLHGLADGGALARELARRTRRHYGTAFPALVERLTRAGALEGLGDNLRELERAILAASVKQAAGGQALRVGQRFALVALAGELATEWQITGWTQGDATRAAATCFRAWIDARGGAGNSEERSMLAQVREFLERHGEARFTDWGRPALEDDHAPRVVNRAGYRRRREADDGLDYYVFPETFRTEICRGFDHQAVARVLKSRGYLRCEGDRLTCKPRLPGEGLRRVYLISSALMDGDDAAA